MEEGIKGIPKFATGVEFAKMSDGNVVLTFSSQSPNSEEKLIIETIMVDAAHAHEIVQVLSNLLQEKSDSNDIG